LVRFPEGAHGGARVSEQVRSYDLYPTILARLELKAQTDHEGTALEGYLQGEMTGSMWCPLIGQNAGGTGPLLGIRHQQLKYMVDIDSGQEWLYDLSKDPKETTSVLESQPKLLTQLQAVLRADRAQLEAIQGSFFEAVD
jgi:arylsulfatase A-like enzyme